MANLIKMDLRRLFLSKVFYLTMGIVAFLNIVILTAIPLLTKMFAPGAEASVTKLSDIIANPFSIPWMIIAVFISMVSFSYADMANGYIKNIGGENMTEVLLFNIENGKAIKIKNLCRKMYISAREVGENDFGVKLFRASPGMSDD